MTLVAYAVSVKTVGVSIPDSTDISFSPNRWRSTPCALTAYSMYKRYTPHIKFCVTALTYSLLNQIKRVTTGHLFGVPRVIANCCFEGRHFPFHLYQMEMGSKEEERRLVDGGGGWERGGAGGKRASANTLSRNL